MYQYKAKVAHIADGDTITLDVDLGFRTVQTMTFRLYGINTPEVIGIQKAAGLAAKKFVESTIPVGTEIVIKTYKDAKEKYGRYLADIYPNGWTGTLNAALIEKGLAQPYFGEGAKPV